MHPEPSDLSSQGHFTNVMNHINHYYNIGKQDTIVLNHKQSIVYNKNNKSRIAISEVSESSSLHIT